MIRARTIRRKLGGSDNLFEPFPLKPKGMHWASYERLEIKADRAFERAMIATGLFPQIAEMRRKKSS